MVRIAKSSGKAQHKFVLGDPYVVDFETDNKHVTISKNGHSYTLTAYDFKNNYRILEENVDAHDNQRQSWV